MKTKPNQNIGLQVVSTLLMIGGAFIVVCTLLPVLNPAEWESLLRHSTHSGMQRGANFYFIWYTAGGLVSLSLFGLGYFFSRKAKLWG